MNDYVDLSRLEDSIDDDDILSDNDKICEGNEQSLSDDDKMQQQ